MRAGFPLFCLMLPALAEGQIQILFNDAPLRSSLDLGSTVTGDARDFTFTITAGGSGQTITRIAAAGAGFTLSAMPVVPFPLLAGQSTSAVVRFQSAASGVYSAAFTVNDFSSVLRISVVGGLTLVDVTGGGRAIISTGSNIQFPVSTAGKAQRRSFSLENQASSPVPVPALGLTGAGLKLFIDLPAGQNIPPKAAYTFQMEASSDMLDLLRGTLIIGGKVFEVSATFTNPILPAGHINYDFNSVKSGAQIPVSIVFDEDPPGNSSGQLRLRAGLNSSDDEGLSFLDNNSRTISFQVRKGERRAMFGTAPYTILQSGTTSAIVNLEFVAANSAANVSLNLAPLPVQIDSVRATRGVNTLEVVMSGFDNTRKVGGELFFTFYDRNGAELPGGVYSKVSLGDSFANYFRSSTAGGMFELRTVFPVSGDSSGVTAVDVRIANTIAATKTERINFQ